MEQPAIKTTPSMTSDIGEIMMDAHGGLLVLVEFSTMESMGKIYSENFIASLKQRIEEQLATVFDRLVEKGAVLCRAGWADPYLLIGAQGTLFDPEVASLVVNETLSEIDQVEYPVDNGFEQVFLSSLQSVSAAVRHLGFMTVDQIAETLLIELNERKMRKLRELAFWEHDQALSKSPWMTPANEWKPRNKTASGARLVRSLSRLLQDHRLGLSADVLVSNHPNDASVLRFALTGTVRDAADSAKWDDKELRRLCCRFHLSQELDRTLLRQSLSITAKLNRMLSTKKLTQVQRIQVPVTLNTLKEVANQTTLPSKLRQELAAADIQLTWYLVDIKQHRPRLASEIAQLESWLAIAKAKIPGLQIMLDISEAQPQRIEIAGIDEVCVTHAKPLEDSLLADDVAAVTILKQGQTISPRMKRLTVRRSLANTSLTTQTDGLERQIQRLMDTMALLEEPHSDEPATNKATTVVDARSRFSPNRLKH